ncbi:hypothetical protein [Maritimibacter sp. HL-12]|uniref:hypothetical protein n=1 Tax=Maritimibacter sp. HL-12 TaxID=1162418 RepID=UPI000A0F00DE|nr:hypothetical protein [Maritimibacter sp. HL-12]SMH58100.1 hypothetical protein SAMN05661107_3533 [Maritimibacter sp. HL-12]
MTDLELTQHARTRFSQRSFRECDTSLLLMIGSETHEGFMVLERDYLAFEAEMKKLLERVRHLVGKRIVVESGQIITGYHCRRRATKQLLRKSKEKGVWTC